MRRLFICSLLAFSLFLVSCGYKTLPVPYALPELSLAVISFDKPLFKGDHLQLSWNDVPASLFRISVYGQGLICSHCKSDLIGFIEISYEDHGVILDGDPDALKNGMIHYFDLGGRHVLMIDRFLTDKWEESGYYYLTIAYRDYENIVSRPSDPVRPISSSRIITPEIKIERTIHGFQEESSLTMIKWNPKPEVIYHGIKDNGARIEKTVLYGLNLYKPENLYDSYGGIKINNQPLTTGQASLEIHEEGLLACYVDRFGNESKRVLIKGKTWMNKPKKGDEL
jgi:hypothetical protein